MAGKTISDNVVPISLAVAETLIWLGADPTSIYSPELIPESYRDNINGKSRSNGKNERHGDGGRTQSKVEKQLRELEEKLSSAAGTEKKRIKTKIERIKTSAQKARKGEEHSKANKR
ncbi:hypothetical protein FAZ19_09755 [Sphingobacterium alkalisoli]|uniref:Uncharacterized protein n=2 Tax=Sphingobacterium alkalisoli TaxID=1874115 RepID=A0A4U0H2W2_9SPHI|nr:hypothetical protein [Sphingobacterium alkalisoli]TJY65424.1 hypothetical protein FAZ19_09755 [Sphingobacterium alkalisoli]